MTGWTSVTSAHPRNRTCHVREDLGKLLPAILQDEGSGDSLRAVVDIGNERFNQVPEFPCFPLPSSQTVLWPARAAPHRAPVAGRGTWYMWFAIRASKALSAKEIDCASTVLNVGAVGSFLEFLLRRLDHPIRGIGEGQ